MLPNREFAKGGAQAALALNALTAETAPPRRTVDDCMRCGLRRVVHSSIVVVVTDFNGENRIVEAGICGACARRMSR